MLTRYACTAAELSCVIGNIFAELSPPCAACGAEVLQITGTTVTGNAATLTVTEAGFDFDGCADDTAIPSPLSTAGTNTGSPIPEHTAFRRLAKVINSEDFLL